MSYYYFPVLLFVLIFLPSIFDIFVKIFTLILFFVAWLLNGVYEFASAIVAKISRVKLYK